MQKSLIKKLNMWRLACDENHTLHRIGSEQYEPIRQAMVLDPDEWEELPADFAAVIDARNAKIAEIDAYDCSPAVNSFTLNGNVIWLDKATRVGLVNSVNTEKAAGRSATILWFGVHCYTIPVDLALAMLAQLELYALACYNITAGHRAAVSALTDIDALTTYDHTAGYPARPEFNTSA